MPSAIDRKERLNFRLDRKQKVLIERAASASGQTLTEFALSHLVRDAQSVLQQRQATILSDRDRDAFLAMLNSDAQPNEALKKAAKTYRKQLV